MSKFAPVAPVQFLRELGEYRDWQINSPDDRFNLLGDYHLLLAHDIIASCDAWGGVLPMSSTIIIDNSVIELGEAVGVDALLKAYDIFLSLMYDPHNIVLVLPEKLDDALTSSYMSSNACNLLGEMGVHSPLMYVVQGKTPEEIDDSFRYLRGILGGHRTKFGRAIEWIGIPRRLVDNMGTRAYALGQATKLKLLHPQLKIHLLGFSNNIQDDIWCAKHSMVEGIDSSVPLRLGVQEQRINFHFDGDQAGPRGAWWDNPGSVNAHVRDNLIRIRETIYNFDYQPRLEIAI
jgi:hypothetical protein